jgi:hypothetical protein
VLEKPHCSGAIGLLLSVSQELSDERAAGWRGVGSKVEADGEKSSQIVNNTHGPLGVNDGLA